MNTCIDPQIGRLRHDYELRFLTEAETEKFEIHVMSCTACLEQIQSFREASDLIAHDPEIRNLINELGTEKEKSISFWEKLGQMLWPRTNLLLRPGLLYLILTAMLPMSYFAFRNVSVAPGASTEMRAARVDFSSFRTRSSMQVCSIADKELLNMNFTDTDAKARNYSTIRWMLRTTDGREVTPLREAALNESKSVSLPIPTMLLGSGTYDLWIYPADTSGRLRDTTMPYRFKVVK